MPRNREWKVGSNRGKLKARLLMESHLKRKLLPYPKELVHHKDSNSENDNIDNLEVVTTKEHFQKHPRRAGRKAILSPPNQSWCGHCKRFRHISEFSFCDSRRNSCADTCRDCRSEIWKQRRKAKK